MIMGGVNEGTMPSTAMVRIEDVINSETDNIYYQLAGGLTIANLLHGSANPIGGQNAIIKLKWGEGPDGLMFKEAPGGIKFALGENVKQSNWGDNKKTRFPQSRMGVPVFYENRFTAAQHYQQAWSKFESGRAPRPKRDLEMDCLVEILEGKRWIHCHSYRQDEILVFLRVMERFGVQVGTLQHVLEGYKIADEIAEHGAGASCFTDWWAYKFEVIDAIPYAGSLMHERGALVSFNSDDSDLARRMNLEAAKAVKYGNTPPEEALNFVTRYPAQQLRIDHLVGSLEKGKHADFVLWSGSPLDSRSTCLETWIEGVKYFDLYTDDERTKLRRGEKAKLLAKVKKEAGYQNESTESEKEMEQKWRHFFNLALEKQNEGRILHCDD
jgi:N-acetylglucosamine-6-phosphate deacetylase